MTEVSPGPCRELAHALSVAWRERRKLTRVPRTKLALLPLLRQSQASDEAIQTADATVDAAREALEECYGASGR